MTARRRPTRGSLAALALIGATVIALLVLLAGAGNGDRRVVATFDRVNGLVEGGKVTLAGVRVGTVERIAFDAAGYPRVTLRVDGDVGLRAPVRADLRMSALSGTANRFVNLTSGRGRPVHGDVTVGRAHTDQPVEIDEVLSTLDAPARKDLDRLLAAMRRSLDGRAGDLGVALRRGGPGFGAIADAVNQANADRRALQGLVQSSAEVMGALGGDRQAAPAAVDGLAELLATTAARQSDLRATIAGLAPGLRSGRSALDRVTRAVPTLRSLVRDSRPVATVLPAFSRRLSGALTAAPPTLDQVRGLVAAAPAQLAALAPLVREATPFLRRVAAVTRAANPMLDSFRVAFPDFLMFFSNWADFTANYDAAGHGGRVAIVPAPVPNTKLGPDDSGAGLLRLPFTRAPGAMEGEPWRDYQDSFVGGDR